VRGRRLPTGVVAEDGRRREIGEAVHGKAASGEQDSHEVVVVVAEGDRGGEIVGRLDIK
jgi:hypothetical protein